MTTKKFNENNEYIFTEATRRLSSKNKEYANENDRLHNFKCNAEYVGLSPDKVGMILLMKNLTALKDGIMDNREMSIEFIDEKLIDTICYLSLLRGLLIEDKIVSDCRCKDIVNNDKNTVESKQTDYEEIMDYNNG